MNVVSDPLSVAERRELARAAFAAARAGGIAAAQWRSWRRADPACIVLMAFDPAGERERIKKQWSTEVEK